MSLTWLPFTGEVSLRPGSKFYDEANTSIRVAVYAIGLDEDGFVKWVSCRRTIYRSHLTDDYEDCVLAADVVEFWPNY